MLTHAVCLIGFCYKKAIPWRSLSPKLVHNPSLRRSFRHKKVYSSYNTHAFIKKQINSSGITANHVLKTGTQKQSANFSATPFKPTSFPRLHHKINSILLVIPLKQLTSTFKKRRHREEESSYFKSAFDIRKCILSLTDKITSLPTFLIAALPLLLHDSKEKSQRSATEDHEFSTVEELLTEVIQESESNANQEEQQPTFAQIEQANKIIRWFEFVWIVLAESHTLLLAAVLTLGAATLEIMVLKQSGVVMDLIRNNNLKHELWALLFSVLACAACQFASYAVLSHASDKIRCRLADYAFTSLVHQDKSYFEARNNSEIIGGLSADLIEIKKAMMHTITVGVRSMAIIVGGVVSAWMKNPTLAVLMISAVGSAVFLGSVYTYFLRKLSRQSRQSVEKANESANQAINAITTVQAFNGEEREIAKHKALVEYSAQKSTEFGLGMAAFKAISTAGVGGIMLGIIAIGGSMVTTGAISAGDLATFISLSASIRTSFANISQLIGEQSAAVDSINRVMEIIDLRPSINFFRPPFFQNFPNISSVHPIWSKGDEEINKYRKVDHFAGKISFEEVGFAYPTRTDHIVLHGITFNVEAGQTISLVGKSGSGKSTISRLLLRFFDPSHGRITFDGVDSTEIDPHWLRSQIAFVEQEPTLFQGTILQNIGYSNPAASRQEIEDAAHKANCTFIDTFPERFDTMVGERGTQLSGGQKQRIAIARALLKNPKILILDEATSALDASSEALVQEALQTLMKGRTTIIIAHRLSTVQHSDKIVVLDHGAVMEIGNHEELLLQNGVYAHLVKKQSSKH